MHSDVIQGLVKNEDLLLRKDNSEELANCYNALLIFVSLAKN